MAGRNPILEEPEKHNVTFEKAQWVDLEKIAKRNRISIHEVIRQAVDDLRERQKKAVAQS